MYLKMALYGAPEATLALFGVHLYLWKAGILLALPASTGAPMQYLPRPSVGEINWSAGRTGSP